MKVNYLLILDRRPPWVKNYHQLCNYANFAGKFCFSSYQDFQRNSEIERRRRLRRNDARKDEDDAEEEPLQN